MVIKTLIEVLKTIDGVIVVNVQDRKTYPNIEFTISSSLSRLLFVECTEASNIHLNSWINFSVCDKEALENPDLGITYSFRNKNIEVFKDLGSFFVWRLHALGKMQEQQADKYLLIFNGTTIKEKKQLNLWKESSQLPR